MINRRGDKINELLDFLDELEQIIPENLEEYKDNFEKRAACERYFEKIIEAVVDLAFLIIREEKLKSPDNDKQAFEILKSSGFISEEIAEKMKDAKSMRNIIAHEYGVVDNDLVFEAIKDLIVPDVTKFINEINEK
jgi:uncharacterized protein YutE (UPF0331/DUF86 family)